MKANLLRTVCWALFICSLIAQSPDAPAETNSKAQEEPTQEPAQTKEEPTIDFTPYPNVRQLVGDDFINFTHNNTSPDGFLAFFGASWCGHCRKFKPIFAEMSEIAPNRNETSTKPGFIYHPVENRNNQVAKLFRVKGYPTLIYIRKNNWWEYNGDRNSTKILEWVDKLVADGTTGKPYPDRLPTFSEEFVEHWEDFKQAVYFQYTHYPIMFFGLIGILVVFVIMCVSTCAQLASDDSGDYVPDAAARADQQKLKAAKILEKSKLEQSKKDK